MNDTKSIAQLLSTSSEMSPLNIHGSFLLIIVRLLMLPIYELLQSACAWKYEELKFVDEMLLNTAENDQITSHRRRL